MVKKLYTEANIQDIADAIRQKNGSSATYTTAEMPAAIQAIPTGDGEISVVNGIIEYYKSKTDTISANTFVEFIEGELDNDSIQQHGTDTRISAGTFAYDRSSAVRIGEEKVIVFFRYGNYLYGVVCHFAVATTNIIIGTPVQLSTASNSFYARAAGQPGMEKVFVAYRGNNDYLYGMICAISGTTITAGTETLLSDTTTLGLYSPSVTFVGLSEVFIAYQKGSYLYGMICTVSVSGTTITAGTETQLSNVSNSSQGASAVALDSERVFIAHRNGSYLYGMICTISGTTITAGTDIQLSTQSYSYTNSSITLIGSDILFIAYMGGNSSYLYGMICTISGTTITAGTETQLSNVSNSSQGASAVALDSERVFIAHRNGSYLYGMICTISGTTITAGTDIQLSTQSYSYDYASAVLVRDDKLFISHRGSDYLYGLGIMGEKTIQASTYKIEGLTRTAATTSTVADVWVLNN